jgi:hypothetical protein
MQATFHRAYRSRAGDAQVESGQEDRFGELEKIYTLNIADRTFTLLKVRWVANERIVDDVANIQLIEMHREWDESEPFIEARHVAGQVLLALTPLTMEGADDRPTAAILDRTFLEFADGK